MHMVICTEGSAQAMETVKFGALIARACRAEVTLLGVAENPSDDAAIAEALKKSEDALAERSVPARVEKAAGNPVAQIAQWAERHRPDLILIGAIRKGRRGPYCMSLKAYQVLKKINFPVLICLGARQELSKILICSGGRNYIAGGFQITARIAECSRAAVTLLNVVTAPPGIFSNIPQWKETTDEVMNSKTALGQTLRQQRDAFQKMNVLADVKVRAGLVLPEIFDEIQEGNYDLIVVGASLSADPISKYVLSDVSREVLNQSDRPVLVVRSQSEQSRSRWRWWWSWFRRRDKR